MNKGLPPTPAPLQLLSASCIIHFSAKKRIHGEGGDGVVCAYMWHMRMPMWVLCQEGVLVTSHRNLPADINRKEYWAGQETARRMKEPGSEVV